MSNEQPQQGKSKKPSKILLEKYITDGLSAYEIAKKLKISHKTVYNYLDKFKLRENYQTNKKNTHDQIKDIARTASYEYLLMIMFKIENKKELRAWEVNFLTSLNKADGLIEAKTSNDDDGKGKIDELIDAIQEARQIPDEPEEEEESRLRENRGKLIFYE